MGCSVTLAFSPEPSPLVAHWQFDPLLSVFGRLLWATVFHVSNSFDAPVKAIPRSVVLLRSCLHGLRSPSKSQRSHSGRFHHLPSLLMSPVTTSLLAQTLVSGFALKRSCIHAHRLTVIIGSGISGASFARTLLDIDQERDDNSDPLSVVMLEAQETCSGATGRWVTGRPSLLQPR